MKTKSKSTAGRGVNSSSRKCLVKGKCEACICGNTYRRSARAARYVLLVFGVRSIMDAGADSDPTPPTLSAARRTDDEVSGLHSRCTWLRAGVCLIRLGIYAVNVVGTCKK